MIFIPQWGRGEK